MEIANGAPCCQLESREQTTSSDFFFRFSTSCANSIARRRRASELLRTALMRFKRNTIAFYVAILQIRGPLLYFIYSRVFFGAKLRDVSRAPPLWRTLDSAFVKFKKRESKTLCVLSLVVIIFVKRQRETLSLFYFLFPE